MCCPKCISFFVNPMFTQGLALRVEQPPLGRAKFWRQAGLAHVATSGRTGGFAAAVGADPSTHRDMVWMKIGKTEC